MDDREERLDRAAGVVLMAGVVVGLLALAIGEGLLMAGRPAGGAGTGSPQLAFAGALGLQPAALLEAGILILMATPVAGVVLLALGFCWLRRFRFALLSALVLGLLFVSFLVASGG